MKLAEAFSFFNLFPFFNGFKFVTRDASTHSIVLKQIYFKAVIVVFAVCLLLHAAQIDFRDEDEKSKQVEYYITSKVSIFFFVLLPLWFICSSCLFPYSFGCRLRMFRKSLQIELNIPEMKTKYFFLPFFSSEMKLSFVTHMLFIWKFFKFTNIKFDTR